MKKLLELLLKIAKRPKEAAVMINEVVRKLAKLLKESSLGAPKKVGRKLGKFGKGIGIGVGGAVGGGVILDKLDDSDDAGLGLLTNVDKNIAEINSKIKGPSELEGRTPAARTDISAAMAATDPKLQEHSTEIKDAIKAIQDMKKPLEDLVRVLTPQATKTTSGDIVVPVPVTSVAPSTPTPAEVIKGEKGEGGTKEVKQEITELDKVMSDFGDHSMNIFEDMARQGDVSAKSIAESFKNVALSSLFNQIIPMMFGLPPGGGARATGGRVYGGQSYLVGEKGPEILTPDGAATISPHGRGGASSGGNANITQNINFTTDVKNTVRAEVLNAAPHIVREAAKAVQFNLTRGRRYI